MTSEVSKDERLWQSLAKDLQSNGGLALIPLANDEQEIIEKGFACGRKAFEFLSNGTKDASVLCIGPTEDSAHATGYHPAASKNSMSRYNAHREGFVFSDGDMFSIEGQKEFKENMQELQKTLHLVANKVMTGVEQHLNLPEMWFQKTFGCFPGNHSQWHLKRYVDNAQALSELKTNEKEKEEEDVKVLLPSHTDPSLISVVVIDHTNIETGTTNGLQYLKRIPGQEKQIWTDICASPSKSSASVGVAIVFVGSVLSLVTGGKFPSAKHRVIKVGKVQERIAATFFLRPKGTAILQVPPSPEMEDVSLKKRVTFDTWSSKVSRNYMKQKTVQNQK